MQRRASQLTIAFDPEWRQQSAWDTPVPAVDLTKAFPATSRNYLDIDETNEDIFDCTGEDFLLEILVGSFARLTIDFDFDPDVVAGLVAGAYGSPASPSAGTDELQTETISATGGSRTLTVATGANEQTTTALAFDADAATIQAALEALSNVAPGDIVVDDPDGTHRTYDFSGGAFAGQDVPMIKVNTFLLTGGTSVFAQTTPGVGSAHAISRITGYTLPLLTFYIGFRGSSEQPYIFKNVVVDSIRVRSASRERVTVTVQLIGSADLVQAIGFSMPDCYDPIPLRFGDCAMSLGGYDFIANNLGREFEYYYQNDVQPKFDGQGVFSTRHERADRRPSGINMWVLGEPGDSWWDLAKSKTTLPAFIQCGPAGRHIKFSAPQGLTKLAPTPIRFGGDPAESELALVIRPKKVSGLGTTPTNVEAVIAMPTVLLDIA